MTKEELALLSGESNYQNSNTVFSRFNELKLNGRTGVLSLTKFADEKGAEGYQSEIVEEPARVVFLKIRRKMQMFDNNRPVLVSHEYDSPTQSIILSDATRGTEKELKTKFGKDLKATVVVYALLFTGTQKLLVKIPVSGSSLFDDNEDAGLRFYNYMGKFDKKNGEHSFEYFTAITTTEKQGDNGAYYALAFARDAKLDDSVMEVVAGEIVRLSEELGATDAANEKSLPKIFGAKTISEEKFNNFASGDRIEYPDEDINPDDIPF